MNRTIYLNYDIDGIPTNAYSVLLSSSEGTYGIKKTDGTVVIADGTTVSNPATGEYEYTFTVENNIVYRACWEVIPTSGDTARYITEDIGPFFEEDTVRAVAEFKGRFSIGTIASFFLRITNMDGEPVDPETITLAIKDSGGDLVIDSNETTRYPNRYTKGWYAYDWTIPTDQTVGNYTITWSYTIAGSERIVVQEFVVVALDPIVSGNDPNSLRMLDIREALDYMITCAQHIPVYSEPAKKSSDNKTFYFSFPRWNQSPGVRIYRNDKIITSGATVDYSNGKVIFDNAQTDYDRIYADYNFRWFEDAAIDRFLKNSLGIFNMYPPYSGHNLYSVPDQYLPLVLYGAAVDAFRHIMLCLQFQQPQLVFGGAEGAKSAFGNIDSLKKNYEETWNKGLETKKLGSYVGLTRLIVQPAFSLPGSRCLSPTSSIITMENEKSVYTISIKEVYTKFEEGKNLKVLSTDYNGNLIFSKVNKVWNSGIKTLYRITTKDNFSVDASIDHLFFVDEKYIRLSEIKIGDILTCFKNFELIKDEVISIDKLKEEETYDIEVESENLFANGIKCHNSRFFRYMFSSAS